MSNLEPEDLVDGIGPAETAIVDDVPTDDPDRPDDVANYLLDAIDRQDSETLRDVAHYALELAAYQDRDLDADDLDDEEVLEDGEELVDVQEDSSGGGVIVKKKIDCGKETCTSCPHGPYKYRNYRENGEHKTEYLGPA